MKKILSIMAVCAVFALASCNNAKDSSKDAMDSTATKVENATDSMPPAPMDTTPKMDTTGNKMSK